MSYSVAGTFVFLTCLVTLDSVQAIIGNRTWNYTDQQFWTTVEEWDCGGMRQSPINIATNNLVMSGQLIDLVLTNFDQSYSGNFTNTGHSVEFIPNEGSPIASFRNHQGTYQLQEFIFHWGSSDLAGSEHTIDGLPYSGELHFVTRRIDRIGNESDAFAVIGVLLRSDDSASPNPTLMTLRSNIPTQAESTNIISEVTPADFLPNDLSYYYYQGSLTAPACREVAQWFLLRNPVSLPPAFFESLRTTVQGENDRILAMNVRMTQNLNNRNVMIQVESRGGGGDDNDNGASSAIGKGTFLFVAVIMCLLSY